MKIMSKINITNLGRPELSIGSVMVSMSPGPEVTMGNTSGAVISSFPNDDDQMFLKEEAWNKLFGNSREFTKFEGFSSNKSEEMESENISENTRIRWTKEVNKIVMRCFYRSSPRKRGYRNQMMKVLALTSMTSCWH